MEEVLKSYIAGLIDADGCINVARLSAGTPTLRVSLANQNPKPLNLLKEAYGGYIRISGQTCTAWMTNNKQTLREILTDIEPYLLIKRDRALLALEYLNLDVGRGGSGNTEFNPARQRRIEIAVEISRLNHVKTPYIQGRIDAFKLKNRK